jgi:hypothetical protein
MREHAGLQEVQATRMLPRLRKKSFAGNGPAPQKHSSY